MSRALVIAAHGSHYAPGTALPAWAAVDAIRQTGLFDEVTAAFWKEQPSFGTVLETLQSDDVTIVPLFSSEGYFTLSVLPAELNPRPGQKVRITPSVGRSDYFIPLIQNRVEQALWQINPLPLQVRKHLNDPSSSDNGLQPIESGQGAKAALSFPNLRDSLSIVIVGHGTSKHENSQTATNEQAERLRGQYAEVRSAYLEEAPFIRDVYHDATCPTLVIVPFFISEGLHTQADIPALLGLQEPFYEPQSVNGRTVIYTRPVGLETDLYHVVLSLAGHNPEAQFTQSVWESFPKRSPELLNYPVIGEISLAHPDYLCHVTDEDQSPNGLQTLETPAEIRAVLRTNKAGKFRPLATSRDLPDSWKIQTPDIDRRLAALETIYPGSSAVTVYRSAREVGSRQKGKYRPTAALSEARIAKIVETLCAGCVRQPTWHTGQSDFLGCSEPCSVWLEEGLK